MPFSSLLSALPPVFSIFTSWDALSVDGVASAQVNVCSRGVGDRLFWAAATSALISV
jgi:hypothetical protein